MNSDCEESPPLDRESFREPAPSPRWKRGLDITLIWLALPAIIPLSLLIAGLIRLVSAGPALFRQERVGYRGKTFVCFKFRTMHVNADAAIHQAHLDRLMKSGRAMVKMDSQGDARLIPLGLLLRCSGLDEIPQLLNVLRGDMRLVGPRPCLPFEAAKYLPWQHERFNALPGLTGLWQVSGKNNTTFDEMIRLDIDYSRSSSLWLDLRIILMTVPALAVQMLETRRTRNSVRQPARATMV